MRRLAKGSAELATEVSTREPGSTGEISDAQRIEVTRVGEVFGAEQMADGRRVGHEPEVCQARKTDWGPPIDANDG